MPLLLFCLIFNVLRCAEGCAARSDALEGDGVGGGGIVSVEVEGAPSAGIHGHAGVPIEHRAQVGAWSLSLIHI